MVGLQVDEGHRALQSDAVMYSVTSVLFKI